MLCPALFEHGAMQNGRTVLCHKLVMYTVYIYIYIIVYIYIYTVNESISLSLHGSLKHLPDLGGWQKVT